MCALHASTELRSNGARESQSHYFLTGAEIASYDDQTPLLDTLPYLYREPVKAYWDRIEDIVVRVDMPVMLALRDEVVKLDLITTPENMATMETQIGVFKSNNRAPITKTFHRVSLRPYSPDGGRSLQRVGYTYRIGRYFPDLAKPLEDIVRNRQGGSLLIAGAPSVGKSSVMRSVIRYLDQTHYTRNCIVDTNAELTGEGPRGFPYLEYSSRFMVPDPRDQHRLLDEVIANHSPEAVVVDELKYEADVQTAYEAGFDGIRIFSTVHASNFARVIHNPRIQPLLGQISFSEGKNYSRPVYDTLVVLPKRNVMEIYPEFSQAIDRYLKGEALHPDRIDLTKSGGS